MFYKPEIRKRLRAERLQLDEQSIDTAAKQVAAQVIQLNQFIESKTVGFYMANENELDPAPLIHATLQQQKQLFLPTVPKNDGKILDFYSYHPDDTLIENHLGVLEPDISSQSTIDRSQLDIIFVPLVAFDEQCNRLGRGAGFYDHTLSFINEATGKKPLLIGLGYEFQKIPAIVPSKWDIPLDYIITEAKSYQRL